MRLVLIVLLVALATVCAHQLQAQESKSSESSASATSALSLLRLRSRRGAASPGSPKPPKSAADPQLPSPQKPNKLKSSSQSISPRRRELTSSCDSNYSDASIDDEPEDVPKTKDIYVCFDLDETLTIKRAKKESMPTIFGEDDSSKTSRLTMLRNHLTKLKQLSPLVHLYVITFNSNTLASQALTELAGHFDKVVAWDGLQWYNLGKREEIKANFMEHMTVTEHADKDRMILVDDDSKNTDAAAKKGFKAMAVPKNSPPASGPGIQEAQFVELLTKVKSLVGDSG